MTALLENGTLEHASSKAVELPVVDDPMLSWINPLDSTRDGKDYLPQRLYQRKVQTKMRFFSTREYKPRSGPVRHSHRPSKPHISANSIDTRRARHLERNRVAASKCRFKKKKERLQLQRVLESESAKRETLLAEKNALKEEIWHLQNQVFEHAAICDSQQISLQLAKMVQYKLLGADPRLINCPSPNFSAVTLSDGSTRNRSGHIGDVESTALNNEADFVPNYQEGLSERFIGVSNMVHHLSYT